MSNKRIYQIAKELNISHNDIIKFLEQSDVKVSNHMMPVDPNVYNSIMMEFSKEKKIVDRQLKEKARRAIIDNKEVSIDDSIGNIESLSIESKTTDQNIVKESVKKDKSKDKIKDQHIDKKVEDNTITESTENEKPTPLKLKKIDISLYR